MTEQRIGTDEWVEQHEARLATQSELRELVYGFGEQLPLWGRLGLLLLIGLFVPVLTSNPFHIRIAATIALMATLGVGLNVVVGYAGLLDLGFVAFYGIGAYAYAYLSSDFTGVHLPTLLTIPLITVLGAVVGFLLGLPSLRLVGDYLAIVTLAFGQIFVQLMTSLTRVDLSWVPFLTTDGPVNLTRGPNGIIELDSISIFGFVADTLTENYIIRLVVLILVLLFVHHLNNSRLGRAWRAMREDELAAEAMGMPTRLLKLQAFAIGAAIAALAGTLFAAEQKAVFPANFDVTLLITLYGVVVLGGLGSLPGVLLGAVIMIAVPEILRDIELASLLFYVGSVVALIGLIKPRRLVGLLLLNVAIIGLLVQVIAESIWPDSLAELPSVASVFPEFSVSIRFVTAIIDSLPEIVTSIVRNWLAIPVGNQELIGNIALAILIVLILIASRIKQTTQLLITLVPTMYLLALVWEIRLSGQESVTRLIFVGVVLIVLMIYRPHGLLGTQRIEIV
ncbi:MAG: branched-chain amino acid ABC transporter permease [Chloroflexi bacterium]|nr:MAG: branched-chain amino acid ABC transporter permease [Chloroflexota bacterium]